MLLKGDREWQAGPPCTVGQCFAPHKGVWLRVQVRPHQPIKGSFFLIGTQIPYGLGMVLKNGITIVDVYIMKISNKLMKFCSFSPCATEFSAC